KQYDNAAAAYAAAVKLDPSNAAAQRRLGWTLSELSRFNEAIGPLKMALQLQPADIDIYSELGYAWRRLDQNDLAIAAYTQLLNLDAVSAAAHLGLGDVYFYNLAQYARAVQEYERGIQLGRAEARVLFNMGICYETLGNGDSASSAYRRALALD